MTRDEALEFTRAALRMRHNKETTDTIIAALTAAPRVDVRKVVRWYSETVGVTLDANVMAAALRAAGVEVVDG